MKIIEVTNREQLDELYNQSALTWEGLGTDEENCNCIVEWLNNCGALLDSEPVMHITSGKLMNLEYELTGSNRYPDDLNIVSITNINQMKVTFARFNVGARWFDDIVDNNLSREKK